MTIEETKKASAQVIKTLILYARMDGARCLKGLQMARNLSSEIESRNKRYLREKGVDKNERRKKILVRFDFPESKIIPVPMNEDKQRYCSQQ